MTTLSVFIFIKIKILKPAHLEQLIELTEQDFLI